MRNNVLLATVLATLLAPVPSAAHPAQGPWAQMTKTDLDFIHRTLRDNHPGAIDPQSSAFRAWMERGYQEAAAGADRAASLPDMKRVLARYVAGFADGHLTIGYHQQAVHVRWPGIVMGRVGKRYLVTGLAKDWPAPLPAIDAELVSCDARAPDALMNEDILPGRFNLTTLDSVKTRHMFHFFLDDDLVPHQYAQCTFEHGGRRQDYALKWERIRQSDFEQQWNAANPRASKRSTITQLAPGSYWVHLPNFQPDAAAQAELKKLIADMPSLRAAELVVFDLRGNNGGNSQWGYDALAGLYGKPFVDYRMAAQDGKGYTEWRVSAANLRHVDEIAASQVRQFGAESKTAAIFGGLATRMRAALKAGQPFVRQSEPSGMPAGAEPAPLSKARPILVTDSNCASSCLNGADAVLSLPGVRHFGHTTGADTVFMDVRRVELPSGVGAVVFGQKVDRNGLRGNNEPWVPSLQYEGQIGDTAKVQAWVLKNAR